MDEFRLRIKYDTDENEVRIIGNETGLRYLADVCMRIIGKTSPAGHFHLDPEPGNLDEGSTRTLVAYEPD